MNSKKLPFTKEDILKIMIEYPTPFYLYDEKGIVENARRIKRAFSWMPEFKNYFAVKALPNPYILRLLKNEGMGADCSSLPELYLAEYAGLTGEDVMFTSNQTPIHEYEYAINMGAIVNLDDITHIGYIEKSLGKLPELLSFRYNPGPLKGGNAIIGKPEEAKYGHTCEQIFEAVNLAKDKGVKRFGLHTMVASNELNVDYFVETAQILFELASEVNKICGVDLEFINLGGGIGIPYKPEESAVDIEYLASRLHEIYNSILKDKGMTPKIYMECGRMVTGPYGYLITEALHTKDTYKKYIGVDACAANLMRPSMYGAYHHITVLGKEDQDSSKVYDIVGSLCENSDKFAIDRKLPKIEIGDILVIHDTGAHGHSMGYNYNSKLRSAELLMEQDGNVIMIRRAETVDDLFATLEF